MFIHLLVLAKFVAFLVVLLIFAERRVMQLYDSLSGRIVMGVWALLGICAAVPVFIRVTDVVLGTILAADVAVAVFAIGCLLVDLVGRILVALGLIK